MGEDHLPDDCEVCRLLAVVERDGRRCRDLSAVLDPVVGLDLARLKYWVMKMK